MTIKKLVVHHSASPRISTTRSDIDRWHREKGYSQIGYHAVVEGNGRIVKGRPESLKGAHAKGANDGSLGVCLAGNFENEKPKEIQIDRLVDILVKWCREHDLTGEDI